MQTDEREGKKLELFARAVDAMQTPPPSPLKCHWLTKRSH
jgi:hypothetical protein